MQRLVKEYPLNINDYIDVKYGSVNRKTPLVVYLEGKAWLKPLYDGDYETPIDNVIDKFKKNIKKSIVDDEFFENKMIFDFDIKTASLRENKKSFMSFEIFLRQQETFLSLKELGEMLANKYKCIIDEFVYDLNENTFVLSKTKR